MTDRSDIEALIAKSALGDRNAFSDLYDATSAKLFAVCLRVLKQRAAAEDAMQDTYVKVWKHAGQYAQTGHSPMTWLITIARNTAIDRLRATGSTTNIDELSANLADRGLSPEQAAIARSQANRIASCMKELEEDRRAAVQGAYLDGQTYQELANKFDVPLNTMRTWLRRSIEKLKQCMAR